MVRSANRAAGLISLACALALAACGHGSGDAQVAGGAKGILDPSYGVGGRVAYTASSQAPASSLVVTPDGTAYVATWSDVVRIDNTGRAFAGLGFYATGALALDRHGNVFGSVGSSLYKLDPAG